MENDVTHERSNFHVIRNNYTVLILFRFEDRLGKSVLSHYQYSNRINLSYSRREHDFLLSFRKNHNDFLTRYIFVKTFS